MLFFGVFDTDENPLWTFSIRLCTALGLTYDEITRPDQRLPKSRAGGQGSVKMD